VLFGTGVVRFGEAAGSLTLATGSAPDLLLGIGVNEGNVFPNDGYARGEGLLELRFQDTGVVTSETLPDGTPVQLDFTFLLESVGVATGAPSPARVAASAGYFVRAVDQANPGAPLERILGGTDLVSASLATAVGRTVDIEGSLRLNVLALAGREVPGALYSPDVDASIDASNTSRFSITTPKGVSFVAESGHDYAAPAPSQALLLGAGALVLTAVRLRTRFRTRPRPA
jgi:hypothetical protein